MVMLAAFAIAELSDSGRTELIFPLHHYLSSAGVIMSLALMFARIVHIGGGVTWAGAMFFLAFFLFPAVRDAEDGGTGVVVELSRQGVLNFVPVIAILTMLSGFWLYWKVSSGFNSVYMGSGPGMAYGLGAVSTVVAFITGATIIRPNMQKAMALSEKALSASAEERSSLLSKAGEHERRSGKAARAVALLLVITVVAMAVGRYV